MIDYSNEIFTDVAKAVRAVDKGVTVYGEYVRSPSKFPMVTLDEIENVMAGNLVDSSHAENFAAVSYRLQVFSNKQSGKRAEARKLIATADAELQRMGFRRVTYSTTPEMYDSTIYCITATYTAILGANRYVYKR